MNRGRGGKFGGPRGGGRGGGGARGGGNQSGPVYSDSLRDLDIELELLKRKRQIIEQEQNMLDRFANNTNNYSSNYSNQQSSNNYSSNINSRQYDNKQPFYNQPGPSYSSAYSNTPRLGNSDTRPQGVKRQQVWENPSPPKRFNAPQRINPWQNQDPMPEYRPVNQGPPQPKNFSSQNRASMNLKPSIGQRITTKYNPPPERKNFKPSKVTKPNQKSNNPTYYTSEQTKMLIDETNKLIAHTNSMMQKPTTKFQNPKPKFQNPKPKFQNPNPIPAGQVIPKKLNAKTDIGDNILQDTILRPNIQPFGQVKGRLELALGTILKGVKELCADDDTFEFFNLPFIQRTIKQIIRKRIRDIMMNKPVVNSTEVVNRYRQQYPKKTDSEILKIAQDADTYYKKNRGLLHLIESDDPEQFFNMNLQRILSYKLDDLFEDVRNVYTKRVYNIDDIVQKFANESELPKKDENQDNKTVETDATEEMKDTDMEKITDDDKVTDGEKVADEKKVTDEEKISGEKVSGGNSETDENKDIDVQKNTKKENNNEEEKDNKDNGETKSQPNTQECTNTLVKEIMEEYELKNPKTKHYFDLADKIIEQRLPSLLPKYKGTILSILCTNKEFVSFQALLHREKNEMYRQQRLKRNSQNVITLDDDDDDDKKASVSLKPETASSVKTETATSSSSKIDQQATAVITSVTPSKPTTPAEEPSTPGKSTDTAPISTTPTAKPSVTPKPATPTTAKSSMAPVKDAEKNIPSTPKAAAKDILYVKLIGRPELPARAVIYEFLNKFKPNSIKKHKSINNLLVVGFVDKEGYEKILSATESVVGDSTLTIKASEQVITTPIQNKSGQPVNKTPINKTPITNKNITTDKVIKTPIKTEEQITNNDKTPVQTEAKSTTDEARDNTEEILSELDSQINDLLTSIRNTDEENDDLKEEEKNNPEENSTDVDKMDTGAEPDCDKGEVTKKSDEKSDEITDENKEKETDDIKSDQNDEKPTSDLIENTEIDKSDKNNMGTIMEVDDENKTKAATEAVKGVKESGRATPTRSSSRLANVTPSTIKTRRASRLANNN
ncbi:bromodomain-containing protein DDB_G0270170 [Bicyclus anynana]|uniref:Bromodomain-containing protein DDB_G0270170 n=1 Tax=Bicyclus anynana TaxID=110368 RepID=A0A6J1NEF1_BICAN|nr:bromodomain-containing protein DDB_G0270170 [Bicyclus anynana]XP_052743178.1 bromodomain-containing protein DDB_G0270170 [Bicyclus anynana]XP_052743179.1 bromodomain-containing protein DDB_G0270170 [Bicyclus anynana]